MIALIGTEEGLFRLNGTPHREVEGRITALSPGAAFALVDGRRVLGRRPHGWDEVGRVPDQLPEGRCLAEVPGGVWVGTAEAQLVAVGVDGVDVVEGFASAPDRDRWTTPWGGPPDVRTIATGPDDAVYVNIHVGGIVRSDDGGRSWHGVIDMDVDVHQVAPGPAGLLLAACGDEGLARSTDGGKSWEHLTAGLHGTYCRATALATTTPLVTASDGPFTSEGALYRLEGDAFQRCDDGLPAAFPGNLDTGTLAASGQEVVLAAPDGTIHTSTDGGRTWAVGLEGLPSPTWVALAE